MSDSLRVCPLWPPHAATLRLAGGVGKSAGALDRFTALLPA
ncbi:MAG: hypothetical protein ABSA21_13375 [Candidatus Limnocylindrales bacterium]